MPRFDLDGVSADGLSLHSLRASVADVWAHAQLLLRRFGVFRGGNRLPKALFAGCLAAAMLAVLLLSSSGSRMTREQREARVLQLGRVPASSAWSRFTGRNPGDGSDGQQCGCAARDAADAGADKYGSQYFALCLAVKNQQQDLPEWVAHHAAIGAGKIYIFDTGSSPPLNETLQDQIQSGLVEHIWRTADFGSATSRKYPQNEIYAECMKRYGRRHQFIGFIDSDEFLIPMGGTSSVPALLQHLQAFEPIGGLVVNWVVMGSGHKTRPKEGVLQAYTKCMPTVNSHSVHVKSIVNTDFADRPDGPHHWLYRPPFFAVNEHFQRIDGPRNVNITLDKLALFHYVLKSETEFREKMERGSAMGNHKPFSFYTSIDKQATETCLAGTRFGPYD